MSARLPCPPAPRPLEEFAVQFDHLFHTLAQRYEFRTYLSGLLMPRDRSKTLIALVGAEPLDSKWRCASGGYRMCWPGTAARLATGRSLKEAAQNVPKSAWQAVQRRFRDGHIEIWWAAELTLAGYAPGKQGRAVCATTDPNTLPKISTRYPTTWRENRLRYQKSCVSMDCATGPNKATNK